MLKWTSGFSAVSIEIPRTQYSNCASRRRAGAVACGDAYAQSRRRAGDAAPLDAAGRAVNGRLQLATIIDDDN